MSLHEKPEPLKDGMKVTMIEILPLLQETIENGQLFALPLTGKSMFPTLRGGKDTVFLRKAVLPLRKLDLPLYRRDNGRFILHRVIRVDRSGTYTCCGDHQWKKERGIRDDQIIAVVAGFERNGKQYSVDDRTYRLWSRFWDFCLPVRHLIFSIRFRVKRLKKRLFGAKRPK